MDFDFSKRFKGKRMTRMARASVQANGNLNFPPEAARMLGLSLEVSLWICPMGKKDLAVTLVDKDDEDGFSVRKTGPYYYVPARSLMERLGIDFRKARVVFDIIELDEQQNGRPVFKFNRRIIDHSADVPPLNECVDGSGEEGTADESADVGTEGAEA